MKNEKIGKIAHAIFLESKENYFEDNPGKNWILAESIFNNKLKYCWWLAVNFLKKYHSHIIAVVAIASLFANMFMMTLSIITNKESTDLNTRPYVSINMDDPKVFINKADTFYGNNIVLKNKGKIPASKVSTRYYITSDKDLNNMNGLEWFNKTLGGFGSISFIAPEATEKEPGFRSLSPSAEYYYFEAIISYEGLKPIKKYWTHIKKIYYVDRDSGMLYSVYIYGEWDRNRNFAIPQISSEKEVVNLLEKFKKKK